MSSKVEILRDFLYVYENIAFGLDIGWLMDMNALYFFLWSGYRACGFMIQVEFVYECLGNLHLRMR